MQYNTIKECKVWYNPKHVVIEHKFNLHMCLHCFNTNSKRNSKSNALHNLVQLTLLYV